MSAAPEDKRIPLYMAIARCLEWQPKGEPWITQKAERLKKFEDMLPSGSGIDTGTKISEVFTKGRFILTLSFHHMDENGYYDGWTDHAVVVSANLCHDFDLRITGRNRNDVKELLYQTFDWVLRQPVNEYPETKDFCQECGVSFDKVMRSAFEQMFCQECVIKRYEAEQVKKAQEG